MQAIRILVNALKQVFANLPQAVLMSVVPMGLSVGTRLLTGTASWAEAGDMTTDGVALRIADAAILSAALVWIAVRWHRFILLDDRRFLPVPPPAGAMLRCAGVGLLILLISVFVTFLDAGFRHASFQLGGRFFAFLVSLVLTLLSEAFLLILATALPGAAIGAPRPIHAAWRALNPKTGTILVLALLTATASAIAQVIPAAVAVFGTPNVLTGIVQIAVSWLSTMIGLSVLNTLWGHYVEGRPLR